MGTPGVPLVFTKDEIREALKKAKGKVTYAAKALNCSYQVIKNKIDADPDLIKLVSELRHEFDSLLLDSSEDTLLYAQTKRDVDLGNALKASFYILNNKGRERGYIHKDSFDITVAAPDSLSVVVESVEGSSKDLLNDES